MVCSQVYALSFHSFKWIFQRIEVFKFNTFQLSIFFFYVALLGVFFGGFFFLCVLYLKTSPIPKSHWFALMFWPQSFIILYITFRYWTVLSYLLWKVWGLCLGLLSCVWDGIVPALFVENIISLLNALC